MRKFSTQSTLTGSPLRNQNHWGTQTNEHCVFVGIFNCLRSAHLLKDFTSPNKCKESKRSHHTSIHRSYTNAKANSSTEAPEAIASHSATTIKQVVPTASVSDQGRQGTVSLRALLDSGSQTSFLTEDACQN